MSDRTRSVVGIFVLTIIIGFVIEVLSPELQQAGLSERLVNALAAGLTGGGLVFLAINVPKMKS